MHKYLKLCIKQNGVTNQSYKLPIRLIIVFTVSVSKIMQKKKKKKTHKQTRSPVTN